MRALILTDADIAAREGAMLSRLEIGLLGQNVRILYAEPSDDRLHIDAESLITGLNYTSGGSILTLKARARRLVRDIDEHIGFDDPSSSRLDVVHVMGPAAWRIGLHTAASAGAHLAVEILSGHDLSRLRSFENHAVRALKDSAKFAWFAPGASLWKAASERARRATVIATPWGAHASDQISDEPPHDRPASIAILTCGTQPQHVTALLDTLKKFEVPDRTPQEPLIFLDEHAVSRNHSITRHARAIGVTDRLSVVPSLEHSRSLTLRCEALIVPDADGRHRSIILDAMAAGVIVIAARDPLLADLLIDGETAVLTDSTTFDGWNRALERAFAPGGIEVPRIRANARELIRTSRTAAAHVDAIADAYDHLCGKEPIPFHSPHS